MTDRMTFHAFTAFGWSDGPRGVWHNEKLVPPRTQSDIDFWIDIARTAERGRFDTIFFADAVGMGGFMPEDFEGEIRDGRMLLWDPAVVTPVLAKFTEHLGFVFTSSILQDHPFSFARKISTIDQLSDGRVGWNIVTSYSPNAARNFGLDDLPSREDRYAWADEYAKAAYSLWEGSWEDGSLLIDRRNGVFADPAKVHPVDYVSPRYRIQGPHLTSPTPQRTPLLLQAGGSVPGRAFAARHAELQFISGSNDDKIVEDIADVRRLAEQAGRRPKDLKFVLGASFVIGGTEQEARRKAEELADAYDPAEVIASINTATGVNLSADDLDTPLTGLVSGHASGGMSAVLDNLVEGLDPDNPPTLRELVRNRFTKYHTVGTPEQIADRIGRWRDIGVGGLAVGMMPRPHGLTEFVDQVIPVLQERGLAQREYAPGTLRQKVMGYGDRLPHTHPAAEYRRGPVAGAD